MEANRKISEIGVIGVTEISSRAFSLILGMKERIVRRLYLALLIAFLIQLPFLILMNFVGIHSALGGAWAVFYLPAILLLDIIGSPGPGMAPIFTTIEVTVIQEFIVLAIIFPVMVLCARFRSSRRAERLAQSRANIESS